MAAAACEMHPKAVLKAAGTRSTGEALERATQAALARGITTLPAIVVGDAVVDGVHVVEDAASLLSGVPAR